MKIVIIAELPDEKAKDLLQHIRDFDVMNPGCEFRMIAHAPKQTVEEMSETLNIQPPLQLKGTIKS